MSLDPIFLIGTGRCGSSIFGHVLSHHPSLSYLTPFSHRYPDRPYLNRWALRCLSLPGGRRLPSAVTQLSEAYNFWTHHSPGFSNPSRDLTRHDVTPRKAESLRSALLKVTVPSRPRFFAKITGWSRIGYLKAVFPDATFIHLIRDGRDVANSLLHVRFWNGWQGPPGWRYGPLPAKHQETWQEHNKSIVVLAGLTWKVLIESVEKARAKHPNAVIHNIRYEDFITDPITELKEAVSAVNLNWNDSLTSCIADIDLRDQRDRHQEDLRTDQVDVLSDILRNKLKSYGYM